MAALAVEHQVSKGRTHCVELILGQEVEVMMELQVEGMVENRGKAVMVGKVEVMEVVEVVVTEGGEEGGVMEGGMGG